MDLIRGKEFFSKNYIFILPLIWLIINLLQAAFNDLANDEAYYWMYSKNLDIGYFDHPPMIAVMIKAGYFLFKNELGVRILTVLLSTFSILLLYRLTNKKDFILLFVLFCAITDFQAYSFIAVPDSPLIFFSALFFLLYREYLKDDKAMNALALGICVALLLYSKYHGVLILFFTLISNLSLLKRKSFYLIVTVAVLLLLPHILWQIKNDYPSYQFHVINKLQGDYKPSATFEFVLGQLLIFGPFVGLMLIYALLKLRTNEDSYKRAMKFTFIGFFLFFLLATYSAGSEPNWTAASAIPLIVIGHTFITNRPNMRKWAIRLSVFSICLFTIFRINLASDLFPVFGRNAFPEFFDSKTWSQKIDKESAGAPVVIMNSYQRASKFSFYAERDALSLNNIIYRRNQFDMWDIVDSLTGKRIFLVTHCDPPVGVNRFCFQTIKGRECAFFIDNFRAFTKLNISTDENWFHFKPATEVSIPITITSPYDEPVRFDLDSIYPVSLGYRLDYHGNFYEEKMLRSMKDTVLAKAMKMTVKITTPAQEGTYYLRFSFRNGCLPPLINSRLIRFDVEK